MEASIKKSIVIGKISKSDKDYILKSTYQELVDYMLDNPTKFFKIDEKPLNADRVEMQISLTIKKPNNGS